MAPESTDAKAKDYVKDVASQAAIATSFEKLNRKFLDVDVSRHMNAIRDFETMIENV